MYSCWGSSMGNLRISARYLDKPDSPLRTGKVAVRAIERPPVVQAPDSGGPGRRGAVLKPTGLRCSALDIQRRCNIHHTTGVVEVNPGSRYRDAGITSCHT